MHLYGSPVASVVIILVLLFEIVLDTRKKLGHVNLLADSAPDCTGRCMGVWRARRVERCTRMVSKLPPFPIPSLKNMLGSSME